MIPQIDLTRQHEALKVELAAAAARVLASCRFILGPEVAALESELARLCGVSHGIGVASGTDALVIALKAVGVRPGDEVITSAFSFVASATSVLMVGARPVFVDIDPGTYNLDPALVDKAVTPRTRAIMPVHLYGQPAAMDAITAIARARGLAVVEDAAQAVGASYGDRPAGAWGDAACLSFYPTKNLGGCGDGGMILTAREEVARQVRRPRDHGSPSKYEHVAKRDALAMALTDAGIGTAIHYPIAIPAQPMFALPDADRAFPHAARASAEVLSLPCFPELTDAEIEAIARAIRDALGRLH